MKLFKYSLIAALALSGALSACDDDVKYSEATPTPGVFFPVGENISKITIAPEAGSFDIEVARYGFSEEQTYTFVNNFTAGEFSMPASVTFAADQTTANVTVSYDGATLQPGTYNLEIGFAEGQPINKFGETSLKIAVTLPEPVVVAPWTNLGECTFTEPFISQGAYGIPSLTYKVNIEESGDTPGLYRLVAPYGTAFAEAIKATLGEELDDDEYDSNNEGYLEIHAEDPAHVYIMPQITGAVFGDGIIVGMNHAGLYLANGNPYDLVVEKAPGSFGVLKDGVLKLPVKTSLLLLPDLGEEDEGPYIANSKGEVKMIVMPGVSLGDYAATAEYMGQFSNVNTGINSAVANFTFGEDVASAKAGIVRASDAASVAAAITNGSYADAVDVDINDPVASFPLVAGGTHTIVVVTFDEAGEAQESASVTFDVTLRDDNAAWTDLGNAIFADGWILGYFGVDVTQYAYNVPIQESNANPGLYRLKNPWAPTISPIGRFNTDPEAADLYIDARDPEFIMVNPQFSGFVNNAGDDDDFGAVFVMNYEGYFTDYGYTKAQTLNILKTYSIPTATFEDDMFTIFPANSTGTGPFFTDPEDGTQGIYSTRYPAYIMLPEADDVEDGDDTAEEAALKRAAKRPANFNATTRKPFKSAFKINYNKPQNASTRVKVAKNTL